MANLGAIIALAYPDAFVKATTGQYNSILRKAGIVNANLVRAGHAAALIVEPSGIIHYSDFGRYITPGDSGRARTATTDPDVTLPIRATFTSIGTIQNLSEIIDFLIQNPQLTHGEGQLYAGVFYSDRTDRVLRHANQLSLRGSIPYGPFVFNGSNCARYVWSLMWKGLSGIQKRRLIPRLFPSPMPLDMVMCAEVYHRYECHEGELIPFTMKRWPIWKRLFEKPESEHLLRIDKSRLYDGKGTWLTGIGDGSWFTIERLEDEKLEISRRNERGEIIFCHWFSKPKDFDPVQDYRFTFDCNAQFCHLIQDNRSYKVYKVESALGESSKRTQLRQSRIKR